jgi:antitoxin (DNA-binding transcriptional repressor) of toxin-antitoxin stability system
MKRATITYTKNHLSRLLGMVREGETIVVMDRRLPVARIEPVVGGELTTAEHIQSLVERGIATAPRRPLDVKRFLGLPAVEIRKGSSAVKALLSDREESP